MAVDLKGCFLCCQAIGRHMLDAGGGSIINFSSIAGQVGIFEKPAELELNDLVFNEIELIGILNNGGEFPQAIQMLADGRVDPTPMISNRISLEEVVEKGFKECIANIIAD